MLLKVELEQLQMYIANSRAMTKKKKKKKVKKEAELITLRKARRGNQIKHSKPQKAEKEWKKKSNKEQH